MTLVSEARSNQCASVSGSGSGQEGRHSGELHPAAAVGGDDPERRAGDAPVGHRRGGRREGGVDHRSSGLGLDPGEEGQEQDRRQAEHAGEDEEEVEAGEAGIVELLDDLLLPLPRAAAAAGRRSPTGRHIARPGSAGSPASRGRRRRSSRPCRCRTGRRRWRGRASSTSRGWWASQTKPKLPSAANAAPIVRAMPIRQWTTIQPPSPTPTMLETSATRLSAWPIWSSE